MFDRRGAVAKHAKTQTSGLKDFRMTNIFVCLNVQNPGKRRKSTFPDISCVLRRARSRMRTNVRLHVRTSAGTSNACSDAHDVVVFRTHVRIRSMSHQCARMFVRHRTRAHVRTFVRNRSMSTHRAHDVVHVHAHACSYAHLFVCRASCRTNVRAHACSQNARTRNHVIMHARTFVCSHAHATIASSTTRARACAHVRSFVSSPSRIMRRTCVCVVHHAHTCMMRRACVDVMTHTRTCRDACVSCVDRVRLLSHRRARACVDIMHAYVRASCVVHACASITSSCVRTCVHVHASCRAHVRDRTRAHVRVVRRTYVRTRQHVIACVRRCARRFVCVRACDDVHVSTRMRMRTRACDDVAIACVSS